jgi:hypothetical protein
MKIKTNLEWIENLEGLPWKKLAITQYKKSLSEGKSNKEATEDALNKIKEIADKIIDSQPKL